MTFNTVKTCFFSLLVLILLSSCKHMETDIISSSSDGSSTKNENQQDTQDKKDEVDEASAEQEDKLSLQPINGGIFSTQIKGGTDSGYYSVWAEYKLDSPTYIWANRFVDSVWESAKIIGVSEQAISTEPQIAVDKKGNAFAVWVQVSKERSETHEVWGAYYDVDAGWNSAEYIGGGQQEEQLNTARIPIVVMNGVGNAVVVWQQHEVVEGISPFDIWARSYSMADGWGSAELVETNDDGSASNAQLSVVNDGGVIAVWQQFDGMRNNIWANQYQLGKGWDSAKLIENDNSGRMYGVQITSDRLGHAIAVWVQDSETKVVWSNRYTPDSGWSIAEPIESSRGDYLGSVRIASEGIDGNAIAVWFGSDGVNSDIFASRYAVNNGWGRVEVINTMSGGSKISPRITSNEAGYSAVLWSQLKNGNDSHALSLWSNIRTPDTGWGDAIQIQNNITGAYDVAQSDDNGSSMAIWVQEYQTLQSSFSKSGEPWSVAEKVNTTAPNF